MFTRTLMRAQHILSLDCEQSASSQTVHTFHKRVPLERFMIIEFEESEGQHRRSSSEVKHGYLWRGARIQMGV